MILFALCGPRTGDKVSNKVLDFVWELWKNMCDQCMLAVPACRNRGTSALFVPFVALVAQDVLYPILVLNYISWAEGVMPSTAPPALVPLPDVPILMRSFAMCAQSAKTCHLNQTLRRIAADRRKGMKPMVLVLKP